jgi:hypothetical protein
MLDKQVSIFGIDTGDFYSNKEAHLHWKNHQLRGEKKFLKNKVKILTDKIIKNNELSVKQIDTILNKTKKELKGYENDYNIPYDFLKSSIMQVVDSEGLSLIDETINNLVDIYKINQIIKLKNIKIKDSKNRLLNLLANKTNQNILTNGKDHIRKLNENNLNNNRIISVFDSSLLRMMGVKPNEFTDNLMVVQVYYFDVAKDIILNGYEYKGEKYIYYTSSAGQIRTKKCVFIKESIWKQYEKTIMCGLTLDIINAKGGNNPNKHLAYIALTNSATDLWEEFDIDKTIVIDDFETDVFGEFDLIDDADYSITRKHDYVPIPHTDGAGMMLPNAFGKKQRNQMVRLPFVKGLLGIFDFKRFIKENNCMGDIIDIYGVKHNIIDEDIQVIFTKSQTKLWKFYKDWNQYKEFYKQYNCTAGVTNIEEDRIKNATINYQMLQTLTDITDEEIDKICKKSKDKIENVCSSLKTIKSIMGITPSNQRLTPLQEAINIYPSIINDEFVKMNIREVKDSKVKKFKYGKLDIRGKYTFILPDFYAACEYWFMGIKQPKGLLQDGEIFSWLFRNDQELDCLRSPHLYREHAVRYNKAYEDSIVLKEKISLVKNQCNTKQLREISELEQDKLPLRKWFCTDAIYTSSFDMISKILQFDCDGDKSLVVADKDFVQIAKRNMQGIVPLYYNMRKAEPRILNNETIYEGLNAAFKGSGIGLYSNNISKIWNSDVFANGTDKEKQEAIKVIKLLCMENNFVIDEAKTLYMPTRPEWFKPMVSKFTQNPVPHFFKYAKDKEEHQVAELNDCFVH